MRTWIKSNTLVDSQLQLTVFFTIKGINSDSPDMLIVVAIMTIPTKEAAN